MPEATIQNTATIPSQDPVRLGRMDVLVVYQVAGRMTPSTVTLPEETANEVTIQAKIRDVENRVGGHVGKTFSL